MNGQTALRDLENDLNLSIFHCLNEFDWVFFSIIVNP